MTDPADDQYGPIDFLVVEFPTGVPEPSGFDALLAAVDSGHVRILDLEFVSRDGETIVTRDAGDFESPSIRSFTGASSGLLDDEDTATLTGALTDGALAVVVVYEELSILPAISAWTGSGARLALEGHLTPADLDAALDTTESA